MPRTSECHLPLLESNLLQLSDAVRVHVLHLARLAAATLLLALLGCGGPDHPPVGRVSGVVTLDGQPLPDATIMFQPPDGRPSQATTDKSGRYSLVYLDGVPGAKIGPHTVIIRTEIPGEDGQPPIAKEKLPKKYHAESTLKAEVQAGDNTHNFDLTTK